MRFEFSVDIDAPRERVWRAFRDPANLSKWQATLVSSRHEQGPAGEVGGVTRLVYQEGSHRIELVETITHVQEVRELAAKYDSPHGTHQITNRFEDLPSGRTRWHVAAEMHMKGAARLLAPLIRGKVEERIRSDCERFRQAVESGAI